MSDKPLEYAIFNQRFIKTGAFFLFGGVFSLVIINIVFILLYPTALPEFINRQIDLNAEGNFATWLNSTLFLCSGTIAGILAWISHTQEETPEVAKAWIFIGVIFAFLSIDDTAQVHEMISIFIPALLDKLNITHPIIDAYGKYLWIAVLGIPGTFMLLWIGRYLFQRFWQSKAARIWICIGGLLFMSNFPTELAESSITNAQNTVDLKVIYVENRPVWQQLQLIVIIQEATELAGAICFIMSFLCFGQVLVEKRTKLQQPVSVILHPDPDQKSTIRHQEIRQ